MHMWQGVLAQHKRLTMLLVQVPQAQSTRHKPCRHHLVVQINLHCAYRRGSSCVASKSLREWKWRRESVCVRVYGCCVGLPWHVGSLIWYPRCWQHYHLRRLQPEMHSCAPAQHSSQEPKEQPPLCDGKHHVRLVSTKHPQHMHSHSLTHNTLTHSLTHSPTLTHSLTHSHTHAHIARRLMCWVKMRQQRKQQTNFPFLAPSNLHTSSTYTFPPSLSPSLSPSLPLILSSLIFLPNFVPIFLLLFFLNWKRYFST